MAEFTPALVPEVEKELLQKSDTSSGLWTLFTTGASNVKGYELGIVLKPPIGNKIRQSIKNSKLTNNEAEYEAMIASLELAKSLGAEVIKAKCDSQLVVNQHIPREQNDEADALVNLGSSIEDDELSSRTIVQLSRSVIKEGHAEIKSTSLTRDWRNKYIEYLKNRKLPSDPKESRILHTKAARFTLAEDGTLYRRMIDGPPAKYLGLGDTDYILREIYEGTCRNYSGADSLVYKVIRVGYYCVNMEKDTKEFV
ncbi:uncharacterized protein [Nicotiana sylvestris]|uniref:uncharacterized protein n=1 Tax=Nicotiana sylvestris TaxID=4096 RepID=UPI00388C9078